MRRVLSKFMHWNKHKGDKKRLNHKDKTSASDTNHWIQNVVDLTEQNRDAPKGDGKQGNCFYAATVNDSWAVTCCQTQVCLFFQKIKCTLSILAGFSIGSEDVVMFWKCPDQRLTRVGISFDNRGKQCKAHSGLIKPKHIVQGKHKYRTDMWS